MLVLTRKAQQQLHVGNDVVITILQVKGKSVRLGISAPQKVRIMRGELNAALPTTPEQGNAASPAAAPPQAVSATINAAVETTPTTTTVSDHCLSRNAVPPSDSLRSERHADRQTESQSFSRPERPLADRVGALAMLAARRQGW